MNNNELQTKNKFNISVLEESFIDYVDVAEKTIENYKDGIENFARYINSQGITMPQRKDVVSWRNYLRETYSPSTVNSYLTSVKVFFKFLETNRIYPNITNDIKGSKVSSTPKKQVLSVEQAKEIYNSLTDKREKALFSLLITTRS